jgi:CRISPR-associated protein Csd1
VTILQSLERYYGRMAARGEAEAPGWSREKISFAVVIAADGTPVAANDLRDHSARQARPVPLEVPAAVKRTVGIMPNLFWDKTAYLLGRTAGRGETEEEAAFKKRSLRARESHAVFRKAHLDMLEHETDAGLVALRRFLETWVPERFDAPPFMAEMLDANIVFALDGEQRYIHEREAARRLLDARIPGDGTRGICLVSGIEAPLRRLHPVIKGVDGAQSSGAALVSFNLDAFQSHGKQQGDNAPTSEAAAFRYGAALNRLLDRGAPRNRMRIGDATVVFWADASGAEDEAIATAAEDFFARLVAADAGPANADDAGEAAKLRDALEQVAAGRPIAELGLGLMLGTRFHVLGLAPNVARLSVRFWLDDRFDTFAQRLAQHYRDVAVEPPPWGAKLPSVQRLLVMTTTLLEEYKNIPALLAGEVTRAVLAGTRYPRALLTAAITRLRAGDDPGRGWHAAVIKAVINRSGEEAVPVALDPDNPNTAYQLGRLFAVLESAQYAALGRVNATIADRYYGSASTTPARVFGTLLRGLHTHVSDARKRGLGSWIEPRVGEIMLKLPPNLPRTLRLEDQGRFAVGYYHQRASRSAPKAEETQAAEENNDE